ncbi:MAG TPA: YbgC/FadM family acyl-CoA thioesterase [Roseiflexaceae bacterium]|nr:YbgC/FadM family acyl-CoA thioesterase [Roseiflexaceae bacterium]
MSQEHLLGCKVYYEDTDCLGMVYHANYLKYLERGRSEFVSAHTRPIQHWNEAGYLVVVYTMNIAFKRAARLGDLLTVHTAFGLASPYRGRFQQRITRGAELIVSAEVEVVCLGDQQRLREFPEEFQALQG